MEKQKSILKKLLYIIIVMMLCWIYNGYNRSLEYLISSADIFKKETYVNYYPNGNIKEIYHKKNGELTDKYTMFHENGRIAIVGYYENDEKTGEWKEYDNNGKLYKNYRP